MSKIYASIKPLMLFSNFLFYLMFTVEKNRVSVSKISSVLGFCFLGLCAVYKVLNLKILFTEGVRIFLYRLSIYFLVCLSLLSHANCTYYSKSIAAVWEKILSYANILPNSFYSKSFNFCSLQVGVFHVSFMLLFAGHYYSYMEEKRVNVLTEILSSYCLLTHFFAVAVLFANSLFFCSKVIEELNTELEKLRKIEWYRDFRAEDESFVRKSKIKELESRLKIVIREDLTLLIDTYEGISRCVEELNDLLGLSLTAFCLHNVSMLLVSCYYMTKVQIIETFSLMFQTLYCVIIEWILVHSCETFVKEARKTGVILNQLIREGSSQSLKEKVQRFLIYLLHKDIKFSACGLFELNYHLLYEVMSTLITYLVIALQFDASSH